MRWNIRSMARGIVCGTVALAASVVCVAPSATGDEREELRAKVEQVRREAQELARNGDYSGAQKRWEESKALLANFQEGKSAKGEPKRPRPEQAERLAKVAQRLKHLRSAAEHLKEAEMHEIAMDMMRRADDMERDLVRAKESLARELNARPKESAPQEPSPEVQKHLEANTRALHEHVSETMRRLQEENEQLRNEMRELRTMVERIAKDRKRPRDQ